MRYDKFCLKLPACAHHATQVASVQFYNHPVRVCAGCFPGEDAWEKAKAVVLAGGFFGEIRTVIEFVAGAAIDPSRVLLPPSQERQITATEFNAAGWQFRRKASCDEVSHVWER